MFLSHVDLKNPFLNSVQVTVNIYGHLVPDGNRAAVDKLDVEEPEEKQETAVQ